MFLAATRPVPVAVARSTGTTADPRRVRRALPRRVGAVILESAVVLPVTFLLILGLIVGGVGTFRYNEVAHLSHEVARFASTHAGLYAQEQAAAITAKTLPNVTKDYLINSVALPNAVGLDKSKLKVTISIITPSGTFDWDDAKNTGSRQLNSQVTTNKVTTQVQNVVSVTVSYTWTPELYLTGPITLSSTSVQALAY